ncbi:hypothetical protein [uncultured Castellaniella sp.]|uniref:hypothetical protein n=1 Tax=uncultured Castellaniella sp. TaxID=647907 RepID=UPI00260FE180|nr:hypothetical protein [uncultured Castellaniella sp.]
MPKRPQAAKPETITAYKGFTDALTCTGGDQGAAQASGDQGAAQALGKFSTATAAGIECRARGAEGSALFLVYRHNDWRDEANHGRILHARAVIVGQDGIKPDVWYSLDAEGGVVEVDDE